jgi:hypothetical protein
MRNVLCYKRAITLTFISSRKYNINVKHVGDKQLCKSFIPIKRVIVREFAL